jgi:hypothetical protein
MDMTIKKLQELIRRAGGGGDLSRRDGRVPSRGIVAAMADQDLDHTRVHADLQQATGKAVAVACGD